MSSSGSIPCPDSIMLSCFSPAKPCWGPNSARSPAPQRRRTTSRAETSSVVTEAGCIRSPTRTPRSHFGRSRATTSRPVRTRAARRPRATPVATAQARRDGGGYGPGSARAFSTNATSLQRQLPRIVIRPPISSRSDLDHLLERGAVLPWHVRDHHGQDAADREVDVVGTGVGLPCTRRRGAEPRGQRLDGGCQARVHCRRTRSTPSPGAAEDPVTAAHAAPQRLAEHLAQIAGGAILIGGAEVLIARRVVEWQRDLRLEVAD